MQKNHKHGQCYNTQPYKNHDFDYKLLLKTNHSCNMYIYAFFCRCARFARSPERTTTSCWCSASCATERTTRTASRRRRLSLRRESGYVDSASTVLPAENLRYAVQSALVSRKQPTFVKLRIALFLRMKVPCPINISIDIHELTNRFCRKNVSAFDSAIELNRRDFPGFHQCYFAIRFVPAFCHAQDDVGRCGSKGSPKGLCPWETQEVDVVDLRPCFNPETHVVELHQG